MSPLSAVYRSLLREAFRAYRLAVWNSDHAAIIGTVLLANTEHRHLAEWTLPGMREERARHLGIAWRALTRAGSLMAQANDVRTAKQALQAVDPHRCPWCTAIGDEDEADGHQSGCELARLTNDEPEGDRRWLT